MRSAAGSLESPPREARARRPAQRAAALAGPRLPLFGAASTPVSVVEWSKGVAVSEEKGDFS